MMVTDDKESENQAKNSVYHWIWKLQATEKPVGRICSGSGETPAPEQNCEFHHSGAKEPKTTRIIFHNIQSKYSFADK